MDRWLLGVAYSGGLPIWYGEIRLQKYWSLEATDGQLSFLTKLTSTWMTGFPKSCEMKTNKQSMERAYFTMTGLSTPRRPTFPCTFSKLQQAWSCAFYHLEASPWGLFGEQGGRKKNNVTLLIKSHYSIKYTHLLSKIRWHTWILFPYFIYIRLKSVITTQFQQYHLNGSAHLVQQDRTWCFLY